MAIFTRGHVDRVSRTLFLYRSKFCGELMFEASWVVWNLNAALGKICSQGTRDADGGLCSMMLIFKILKVGVVVIWWCARPFRIDPLQSRQGLGYACLKLHRIKHQLGRKIARLK